MVIVGSGLAGLITGALYNNVPILEPLSETKIHKALLRFRSSDIGDALGIPFKPVQVYKSIWDGDKHIPLTPRAIALYSLKVSDTVSYRSIVHQNPETRWIAPADFQERLLDICKHRIEYNEEPCWRDEGEKVISTIPLPVLASKLDMPVSMPENSNRKIYISTCKISNSDVYMTNYNVCTHSYIYRASITGDTLIIESTKRLREEHMYNVYESFGINDAIIHSIVMNEEQSNGKIVKMNDSIRKNFILQATLRYNIYSLGRLAIWKNIVLDDMYKDMLKIKKIMNSPYDLVSNSI